MLYLSQKWSDCHETKCKHIDWTLGLKCDHRFWPWPWPWPWIFKVKFRICYFLAKNDPIATKQKANISIEFQASNVTNGFDLDHNLDLWIFKVKCDLYLWPHTLPWPWVFMVKYWNSCISEWEGWLTLHKEGGNRSFMTMTMTIWWPRSGVWIYQIVTGVTSVVGVPSTHLVYFNIISCKLKYQFSNSLRIRERGTSGGQLMARYRSDMKPASAWYQTVMHRVGSGLITAWKQRGMGTWFPTKFEVHKLLILCSITRKWRIRSSSNSLTHTPHTQGPYTQTNMFGLYTAKTT